MLKLFFPLKFEEKNSLKIDITISNVSKCINECINKTLKINDKFVILSLTIINRSIRFVYFSFSYLVIWKKKSYRFSNLIDREIPEKKIVLFFDLDDNKKALPNNEIWIKL